MFTNPRWLAVILLLACPALASAQLRFAQPAVNLGELRSGPVYAHRFEFTNDAGQPVEITDIRLGCGCLQPTLERRVYQPGDKGTLYMNLRTLGQPSGERSWQAFVKYRAGDKQFETALVVAATLRTEVAIEPSIIALTVDSTLRQEVTITDQRALPMKITAIQASSPAIRILGQTSVAGVTKVTIEVSRERLTAARQEETLNIYSEDASYRHLQVPITLTRAMRAEVSAAPEKVELMGAAVRLVRIRGNGGQPVRIEKAEANHAGLKVTWAAGPGDDATLRISTSAPSAGVASVRIHFTQPAGATLTIPVILRKE